MSYVLLALQICCFFYPGAGTEIGLETETYTVMESAGSTRVCVLIEGLCTISFPFAISLVTSDDSAGIVLCFLRQNLILTVLSRFTCRLC